VTKGSSCNSRLSVPASAFLKASRLVPTSPNCLRIGCCRSGVALAWENHLPASSRKAFSNWFLVCTSFLPFGVRPITLVSAPDQLVGCNVAQTSRAIFLAFLASRCCFHSDFAVLPLSCACAWISPAIHVSHCSGSAFSRLKHLYASRIWSWMTCGARLKLLACCLMPAFLALVCRTKLPIAHPCLRLSIPFQYKMRLMACETCGHHCTVPACSFLHFVSTCLLYLVAALSMAS